jgi:hypothetical protein
MNDFQDIYNGRDTLYTVDDVTAWHIGGEYFVFTEIPLAIRGVCYTDPDHQIKYTGGGDDQIRFPGADDTILHYTLGVGVVFGPVSQVDIAYNRSLNSDQFSISGVYRF